MEETSVQQASSNEVQGGNIPPTKSLISARTNSTLPQRLAGQIRSISWRSSNATDDRLSHLVKEELDGRPLGYPRLAALENSDSNLVMYRRFGYIHHRLLLHRQAEICALEAKLDALDEEDATNDDTKYRLHSSEFLDGDDPVQKVLLDELETKIKNYDELLLLELKLRSANKPTNRNFRNLYNYIWQRKPLAQGEDSFIFRFQDLVSLADGETVNWFDEAIERVLACFRGILLQPFFAAKKHREKTTDQEIIYYSDSRLGTLIKLVVAFIAVALLMAPVWILTFVNMSATMMVVTVLLFVCAFLGVLSLLTSVKRHEIFLSGATYCAVLVVFLGTLQTKPSASPTLPA